MTKQEDKEYIKLLENFYDKVINLTVMHGVENDSAVVYVSDLGEALMTVDPKWYLRPMRLKNQPSSKL